MSFLNNVFALDLSKNRLHALPVGFETLENLQTLNISSNQIISLSPALSRLHQLHTLHAESNIIEYIPSSFSVLENLKVLDLCRNQLSTFPVALKVLSLTHLMLEHNILEHLDDLLFSSNLGISLEHFSCHDNNLLQLPASLVKLAPHIYFSADTNPFLSPPPALLAHGFPLIQQYLLNRTLRTSDLLELLFDSDFEVDELAMFPRAFEVLVDGTGLMHPEDICEFDTAVDEFLNGNYYNVLYIKRILLLNIVSRKLS